MSLALAIAGTLAVMAGAAWLYEQVDEFLCEWQSPLNSSLEIHMADTVDVGIPFAFSVVAKTKSGKVVADTGITVTTDNGVASVNPDGSGGTGTAATEGNVTLVATDGKITSAPKVLTASDSTVASLEVVVA